MRQCTSFHNLRSRDRRSALDRALILWALILTGVLALLPPSCIAQGQAGSGQEEGKIGRTGGLESIRLQTSLQASEKTISIPAREAAEEKVLLEGVIGPGAYVLGPGDALLLTAWGKTNFTFTLEIDPEGKAVVPNVGEMVLAGKSLHDAKKEIIKAVSRYLKDVSLSVSLARLRVFKVYLLGEVPRPGMYRASGTARVSEVIQDAGGLTKIGSRRNIELRTNAGYAQGVDLDAFTFMGSLEKNPQVSGGDVIFVPPRQHTFMVVGSVHRPGEYELCPGDNLEDAIALAGGTLEGAFLSRVELTRFTSETNVDSIFVSLTDSEADSAGAAIQIQPGDRIFVRSIPEWHKMKNAFIEGEVNYPGMYSIEEGKDTVKDLLRRAGGLTPEADFENAYLSRESFESPDPELERLLNRTTGELPDLEYQYLRTRLRGKQTVLSRSLKSILEDKSYPKGFFLRVNDRIVVPRKELMVRVVGEVKAPGLVPYKERKDAGYYVDLAGGFTDRARAKKVKVFEAGSGQPFSAGDVRWMRPGDTVWVPEKAEIDVWARTRDTINLLAQIATIYLVVNQATK
ncbi:MAG: SLBB domain-containing protein [Candidatus Eisenbacteria bacterium]|nr:SLBB domain-containing protein [Candidatus Eisenbacteria bacterium]